MLLESLIGLVLVLLLVLANGFFVAAEFSLVAIRRSRVEQLISEGNAFAPAVLRGIQHLDASLAACQLGITLASLGLGWIGEPALAGLIEPLFHMLPENLAALGAHSVAVVIAFSLITMLHIVLGELAPKSLALQRTEGTALIIAAPLNIFLTVFRPVIYLMNMMGNLVLRIFGLRPASGEEQVHSVEELRWLVMASHEAGVLDEAESEMIGRVFNFGETRAYEVMVPRTEITAVDADTSQEEAMELVLTEGHTRLPVYEDNLDDIVGVVHLRDLLRVAREGNLLQASVREIMRPPLVMPDSASVEIVLTEMRRNRTQMAILIDEHGGTAGLITMENIMEQIVGDVQDEFEQPHEAISVQTDGTVMLDGLVSIKDFEDRFAIELPDEDYTTVGGLVMARLGRIPTIGDEVMLDSYRLQVEEMDGLRVATVRLTKRTSREELAQEGEASA